MSNFYELYNIKKIRRYILTDYAVVDPNGVDSWIEGYDPKKLKEKVNRILKQEKTEVTNFKTWTIEITADKREKLEDFIIKKYRSLFLSGNNDKRDWHYLTDCLSDWDGDEWLISSGGCATRTEALLSLFEEIYYSLTDGEKEEVKRTVEE